ncbi:MAG TPA: sodium:solute symporter [Syntrophomonadaceae bacterium]|nr:sodium:solute symporter [Syntrophomonadaceae bacterium]
MLSKIDAILVVLYFGVMIICGFIGMRSAKTKEDFLVAGRRLPTWMFLACLSAVVLGGASTIGSTKLGYQFGISGVWLVFMIGFGIILLGILISTNLSKLHVYSINEVLEMHYGPSTRIFSAILTFIYCAMVSTVQVIGLSSILHVMMGWSNKISMIVSGGITIFYTFFGGMWSVTLTDTIQFFLMTIGVVILAPFFGLTKVGGFNELYHSLPANFFNLGNLGFKQIFSYFLLFVPGMMIGQDVWQRVFTAKDENVAKKGTIFSGIYCIIYGIATVLLGMCVLVVFPKLKDPQLSFATGVIKFMPVGAIGITLAGVISALMSTASGTLLASSTILFNDIYIRFINPKIDDKKTLRLNRVLILIIGLIVLMCAIWLQDVLVALDIAYAFLSACIFVPVFAAFFYRKAGYKAAMSSIITSAIAVLFFFFKEGITSTTPIIYGMATSLITFIVVSIFNAMGETKEPKLIKE